MVFDEVSAALEDYLERIYMLQKEGEGVRVKDLAEDLGVKAPSVTEALTHLKTRGLVSQEKYQGVHLTEEGLKIAREVYDRHCMLTKFFHEVLGVEEKQAEEDACRTEHLLGRATVRKLHKLVKLLEDYKKHDPDFLNGLKG
ncbi:MAG TPA: metal-dependent transcriptional regulator [Candidatus Omnitrophota bacterium]|nr:metal-dependent transcriptional regulator [Candidatus Omnitrophota bacterium]HSA30480.1 metal-dependent transcriptional regulator [Candidatus Omnitrophota bacterium]